MAATRTSSRHAAQKAKEAIAAAPDTKSRGGAGSKRKETTEKGPEPKKEKKNDQRPAQKEAKKPVGDKEEEHKEPVREEVQEPTPEQEKEQAQEESTKPAPEHKEEKVQEPTPEPKEEHEERKEEHKEEQKEEKPSEVTAEDEASIQGHEKKAAPVDGADGATESKERENTVPSNILEKGIIYFFYRPRVNVSEPHDVNDVARSFIVLRPTPLETMLDNEQKPIKTEAKCRLMALPKKKFPTSGKERDMAFVEKAGYSMKDLRESFIAGETYVTSTQGERHVPEARPFAEGVYAITSAKRASHLAYILTIPESIGPIQEDFGLHARGSWIVQSKNPKHPGPSYAQLPKDPEYPESVREKFGDYRWAPLQPEFIDYPNAQFLMIGETSGGLGKAASAEPGDTKPGEQQPGEELDQLEHENEERVESLGGDDTIYEDLGLHAKNYPKVPTTWHS